MASISFENVSKIFPGDVRAINDLTLQVDDGELLVLVGPSGCGKTTTLRLVAGLDKTSSGSIRIGGAVVDELAPQKRDVAMVFQNHALYPHMTVQENMAFALRQRRVASQQIDARVSEATDLLELGDILDRYPGEISGGQCQRAAVARAIVLRPRVFLLDEPFSNLDTRLRLRARRLLKRLHQQLQITTIYVTHDQEEAMTLGQRVAVLHQGVLRQRGTPLELYEKPADRFVAEFIGNVAMNFLSGHLSTGHGQLVFAGGSVYLPLAGSRFVELTGTPDRAVEMAIRPAALMPTNDDAGNMAIPVTVESIECLGGAVNLHTRTDSGEQLVARLASVTARAGERILLSVDLDQVHLIALDEDIGPSPDAPNILTRSRT